MFSVLKYMFKLTDSKIHVFSLSYMSWTNVLSHVTTDIKIQISSMTQK